MDMPWFAFVAAVLIVIAVVVAAKKSHPHDGGGSADEGDGGLGSRPPVRPVDGGGPVEPAWWPEFERELARYTAQRERAKSISREPLSVP
jgi:hypothetical protein